MRIEGGSLLMKKGKAVREGMEFIYSAQKRA